jgi:fatty-acyl-CoA synthase
VINTSSALAHNADRRPDEVALIGDGRRVTHAELDRRVSALAAALRERGIGRGDVVGVLLNNRLEYLETVYAVNRLGAVFLLLNYRLAPREWEYMLDHAGARALVTEPELWAGLAPIAPEGLGSVVVVGGGECEAPTLDYDALVAPHVGVHVPDAEVGTDDLQRLMYTSGTTSRPKGVCLTYGNVIHKILGQMVEFSITAADRVLVCGPLYHVGGMDLPGTGVLYAGGSMVVLPRFDAGAVLDSIEAERPTCVWLAPTMVNHVLEREDLLDRDTSSVRFMINGGEKMPVPLMERLLRAFPGCWVADAYGLTETVGGDTFMDRAHVLSKIGSVGKPLLHLEARIAGPEGETLPAGELGEIALRGPKVFKGYWRNPEATAAALRDGWFYTGDVGRTDEDGYLYIEDRKRDLIISGGENIASSEVERVLYEHEAVLEAAVVAVPHERWGEVPKAFVVVREGRQLTADALVAHCGEHLARFKVPKEIEFLPELPRTPSGKVLKRELRAQRSAGAGE